MISYNPLWRTMEQKNISTYALIEKYHVQSKQFTTLSITNISQPQH